MQGRLNLAIESLEGQDLALQLEGNLAPAETETMAAVLPEGTYRAWCPLHEDREGESVQFTTVASDAPSPATATAQTQS